MKFHHWVHWFKESNKRTWSRIPVWNKTLLETVRRREKNSCIKQRRQSEMEWIFEEQLLFVAEERSKPSQSSCKFQGKWHCFLVLSASFRLRSSSSVSLTYIVYSPVFCYLVTAQGRTGRARDTSEGELLLPSRVSLARPVLYCAHWSTLILPSACYAGYPLLDLCASCAGGSKPKHRPYF